MYCTYCGKQIKDNQKFCAYCGKSLILKVPKLLTDPSISTPIKSVEEIEKVNQYKSTDTNKDIEKLETEIEEELTPKKLRRKKTKFWGLFMFLMLLSACIIGAFYYFDWKNKNDVNDPSKTINEFITIPQKR